MKSKLSSLLQKVFLGALAGITSSNTTSATSNPDYSLDDQDTKVETFHSKKIDLSPKLLLKKSINDAWTYMSHRSHRSHSSHRSHYSSSSGSSSSGSSSSGSTSPATQLGNSTLSLPSELKLGSRTLKRGMSGTDVTELINILLKKEYLVLKDGSTQMTGSQIYDEIVEEAVKKFQTANGLEADGICGSSTTYYLKNK